MYKSTKTAIVLFALAPSLAGCERGLRTLPTAPAVAASPAPAVAALPTPVVAASPALPSQRWNLTRTLKSVSTPEGCSQFGQNTERSSDWLMAIQRSGESIRVLISDTSNFSDPWSYDGAVVAEAFSVTGPGFTGFLVCGETHFPYSAQDSITGHFSADGRTMTGEEVDSYRLTLGGTLIYRFEWNATRIDGS